MHGARLPPVCAPAAFCISIHFIHTFYLYNVQATIFPFDLLGFLPAQIKLYQILARCEQRTGYLKACRISSSTTAAMNCQSCRLTPRCCCANPCCGTVRHEDHARQRSTHNTPSFYLLLMRHNRRLWITLELKIRFCVVPQGHHSICLCILLKTSWPHLSGFFSDFMYSHRIWHILRTIFPLLLRRTLALWPQRSVALSSSESTPECTHL